MDMRRFVVVIQGCIYFQCTTSVGKPAVIEYIILIFNVCAEKIVIVIVATYRVAVGQYDVFPVDKFCVAHIYNRIFAGNVLSVNGDVLPDIQAVVILFSLAVLHVDFKLEVSVPTAITLEKYTCGVHMDGTYGLGNVHFR